MNDITELTHIIPPQQVRSARFLMRVLEAAERILRRDGAEGLTMPAVALEAGVSVGGIYRRFQTKQDLLRAIKDRHLNRSEQAMTAAMAADQDSLEDVVQAFLATLTKGSGTGSLFGVIMENQAEDEVMKARGSLCVERQAAAFAAALAPFRDRIRHPEPDVAVDMAFQIAIAVFMRRTKSEARSKQRAPWDQIRRELARAMVAYLTCPVAAA